MKFILPENAVAEADIIRLLITEITRLEGVVDVLNEELIEQDTVIENYNRNNSDD